MGAKGKKIKYTLDILQIVMRAKIKRSLKSTETAVHKNLKL